MCKEQRPLKLKKVKKTHFLEKHLIFLILYTACQKQGAIAGSLQEQEHWEHFTGRKRKCLQAVHMAVGWDEMGWSMHRYAGGTWQSWLQNRVLTHHSVWFRYSVPEPASGHMRCSQYRNYTEWQLSSMSFKIIGQHCMCQNQ